MFRSVAFVLFIGIAALYALPSDAGCFGCGRAARSYGYSTPTAQQTETAYEWRRGRWGRLYLVQVQRPVAVTPSPEIEARPGCCNCRCNCAACNCCKHATAISDKPSGPAPGTSPNDLIFMNECCGGQCKKFKLRRHEWDSYPWKQNCKYTVLRVLNPRDAVPFEDSPVDSAAEPTKPGGVVPGVPVDNGPPSPEA